MSSWAPGMSSSHARMHELEALVRREQAQPGSVDYGARTEVPVMSPSITLLKRVA